MTNGTIGSSRELVAGHWKQLAVQHDPDPTDHRPRGVRRTLLGVRNYRAR